MATLRASTSFFEFDFSLADTMFAQERSTFGDNVGRTIAGRTFQDVASYETRNGSGYHSVYLGGTGLSRGTDTALTAGTVTGLLRYSYRLDDFSTPEYGLTGISLAGADVGAAMKSATLDDDQALLAQAFSGNDKFILSEQDDIATSYAGADVIYGKGGADLLNGGDGNDRIYGNAGDDQIEGGDGDDLLSGGTGIDTLSYQYADAGVTVDLRVTTAQDTGGAGVDTVSGFQRLYGSAFDDVLLGTSAANEIIGLSGNDTIRGRGGDDRIDGREGRDKLSGGAGADSFVMFALNSPDDRDFISDFNRAEGDRILLSKQMFQGLSGDIDSALDAAQFHKGAGAKSAHDASDRVIYDTATGWLYYDADGIGGSAAVQVVHLGKTVHPGLAASDILLSF